MKNEIKVSVELKDGKVLKAFRKLKREIGMCKLGLAIALGGLYYLYRKMEEKNEI